MEQSGWEPGHSELRGGQASKEDSRVNTLSNSVAENSGNEKEGRN